METSENKGETEAQASFTTYRVICSKHGEVSNGTASLSYATRGLDGKVHQTHCLYCLQCLNDVLLAFQEAGAIGKISLVPVKKEKDGETPVAETQTTETLAEEVPAQASLPASEETKSPSVN
jgi:L,D-peptidoglycan transpeptidase YkuD (ErfK/YbiS/YcfS/YnhG family)